MAILRLIYQSEGSDIKAKKANKKLADIAKNTIKELGKIEIRSSISNERIGCIKNKETILPFWSCVDFEAEDFMPDNLLKENGKIQDIKYSYTIDKKGQEVPVIECLLV